MPRSSDPEKDAYARSLLAQQLPISKIRKELKKLFGSAISPNRLIEFKKEMNIQNQNNDLNYNKEGIPFLFKTRRKINPNQFNDETIENIKQNSILIQRIWRRLEKINQFIEITNPIIKKVNKIINEQDFESKNDEADKKKNT